jgi:hypothetical protein
MLSFKICAALEVSLVAIMTPEGDSRGEDLPLNRLPTSDIVVSDLWRDSVGEDPLLSASESTEYMTWLTITLVKRLTVSLNTDEEEEHEILSIYLANTLAP